MNQMINITPSTALKLQYIHRICPIPLRLGQMHYALEPGGVIVIIDDFLSVGVSRDDPDVDLFAKSWIANSVYSTTEVADMAQKNNMALVQDRDLGSQYSIAKLNYRNKAPKLRDEAGRVHQGWLGSKARQKLFLD
eukprot:scaffold31168_cov72-Skeletonema_dohrnii-CCMP3373.AAC.1